MWHCPNTCGNIKSFKQLKFDWHYFIFFYQTDKEEALSVLSSYLQKCCKQRTGLIEMGKNTEILLKQQISAERYQNLSFSIPANVTMFIFVNPATCASIFPAMTSFWEDHDSLSVQFSAPN